jgi:hypothetical protein
VDSFTAASGAAVLSEHGLVNGDAITLRTPTGSGGALPAPLVAGTVYYTLYQTDSFFKVSATPNGAPITLTTDGVAVIVTKDLPFAQLGEFYSRFADGFLPAHVVPLQAPYPITVVGIVAQLVARRIQLLSGTTSESMDALEASAAKQLKRWADGLPVRDAATPPNKPANLATFTNRNSKFIGFHDPTFDSFGNPITFDPLE